MSDSDSLWCLVSRHRIIRLAPTDALRTRQAGLSKGVCPCDEIVDGVLPCTQTHEMLDTLRVASAASSRATPSAKTTAQTPSCQCAMQNDDKPSGEKEAGILPAMIDFEEDIPSGDRTDEVVVVGVPGDERVVQFDSGKFLIGRSKTCDLVVEYRYTSRVHARIIRTGGRFYYLEDISKNGTWVVSDSDTQVCLKAGQRVPLIGSGIIGLGAPPIANTPGTVHFRLMQVAAP